MVFARTMPVCPNGVWENDDSLSKARGEHDVSLTQTLFESVSRCPDDDWRCYNIFIWTNESLANIKRRLCYVALNIDLTIGTRTQRQAGARQLVFDTSSFKINCELYRDLLMFPLSAFHTV